MGHINFSVSLISKLLFATILAFSVVIGVYLVMHKDNKPLSKPSTNHQDTSLHIIGAKPVWE